MFCIGTFASWILISFFGRRTLYLYGMAAMSVTLFVVGGLGWKHDASSQQAAGGLLIALNCES